MHSTNSSFPATLDIPGLTYSTISPNGYIAPDAVSAKLIILMVGLPARGKSYTVKKLARYLNWLQYNTRIFNAGDRRRVVGAVEPHGGSSLSSADFFDPDNPKGIAMRDQIALGTLDELLLWLQHEGGCVGILDATNSTRERRRLILSHVKQKMRPLPGLLFLESSCLDTVILQKNFELKLSGPDYRGQDPVTAMKDLMQRVANYEKSYIPLGDYEENHGIPFVQMINVGEKFRTHLIRGFLSTQVVEYLLNFHLKERQIWITCNGESLDDSVGKIGRPSELSAHGRRYSLALARFILKKREEWEQMREKSCSERVPTTNDNSCFSANKHKGSGHAQDADEYSWDSTDDAAQFSIWTSMMPQAIQTADSFPNNFYAKKQMKMLDDLSPGHVAGLTFKEIEELYPEESAARRRDKLLFRWSGPGGEGYVDVINRLRTVIVELERVTHHILLVTHRAVVRVLLAYFLGLQRDDLAEMKVPKDYVFSLEPVSSFLLNPRNFALTQGSEAIRDRCKRIQIRTGNR
jgi:6-phosphofructo-2-kinase